MLKRLCTKVLVILLSFAANAQEDEYFSPKTEDSQGSTFRRIANKFTLTVTTGYGRTYYKHDIPGLTILDANGELLITDDSSLSPGSSFTAYKYWMNNPQPIVGTLKATDAIYSSDTSTFKIRGTGTNIPINLSLHYTFLEKFRIGGGATFELQSINNLRPTFSDSLGDYQSDYKSTIFKRYFGFFGYNFKNYRNLSYVAEVKVGSFKLSKKYNYTRKSIAFDIGVSAERHMSEYFRIILKPSIEFKNYSVALPNGNVLKHRMITPYVTLGASYNYPDLPRCPIKFCHVQINHTHGGKKFRSRRHAIYKKQNPKYGENYPQLGRYKRKSRKKKVKKVKKTNTSKEQT